LWSRDISSDKGMLLRKYLYINDTNGSVIALNKTSGSTVWKNDKLLLRVPPRHAGGFRDGGRLRATMAQRDGGTRTHQTGWQRNSSTTDWTGRRIAGANPRRRTVFVVYTLDVSAMLVSVM
jgi:hypothetical protein